MKVRFIRMHPRYAYFVGDIAELDNARAKELLDDDIVEVIEEKKKEVKVTAEDQPSIKKTRRRRK